MPRKDTPRLKRAYGWFRGEDYWGDPMSENMVMTDALLHPAAISNTITEPPLDAKDGDQYIVPAGAIGAWEGYDHHLTMLVEGRWWFYAPFYGLRVRVRSVDMFLWWNDTEWVAEPANTLPEPGQANHYDIAISVGYAPEPAETLLFLPIVQPMMLPAGATGSLASALTPPGQGVQLAILRNGSQVGTILYSTSSFNGTILVPNNVIFAPGDRLRVACPLVMPPNFHSFGILLRMSLL